MTYLRWKSTKCVGLEPKNNVHNLHEQFDDHKIMIIETFSALNNQNNQVFIEILEYWS